MKILNSLIAVTLILSATYSVAGADRSATWEITAPEYASPELGNVVGGYSNDVSVQVIFYDNILDLNAKYQELGGDSYVRAFSIPAEIDGKRICFVHVIKPKDWNDKQQLQSFGHEMMHCFGATHIGDINEET